MLKHIFRDNSRRKLFKNSEFFRKWLKCVSLIGRRFLFLNSRIFKKLFFFTKIKNFCWLSGRRRAVFRTFRVSRVVIKGVSFLGPLPGLRKISW